MLLPDGRFVLAGLTQAGTGDMAFARYNSDGSLDTTFGGTGQVTIDIRGTPDQARIALLPGGKILAAGTSRDPNVSRLDSAAVRLNADGSLDTTFGNAGTFVSASEASVRTRRTCSRSTRRAGASWSAWLAGAT